MRFAKYLLALALTFAPMSVLANTVTIPNTFQNGQFIDANLFNQNFQSIATFANGNIDNTNIGVAGFYGSQIKPTTVAQATFGGTIAYTFLTAPIMSGAGITAATIPNASLVTTPLTALTAGANVSITGTAPNLTINATAPAAGVTSVTGSGNIASSGGLTPNITLVAAPSISGVNFTSATVPNAALVTTPLTALTAGTNISITGAAPNLTINAAGATGVTSVGGSGNIISSGGTTPTISITGTPSFVNVSSAAYYFNGQTNALLNSDANNTYLHSVNTAISFVNAPNTALAPVNASAFTVGSDRRLKRNITPYTRGIDTIMALKPVYFVLRSDSKKSMGFIAQDVQQVLPEIVTSSKLKGKVTLGVNYSAIIAPLTAAVQEQQREIVALRAEIKALKQSRK